MSILANDILEEGQWYNVLHSLGTAFILLPHEATHCHAPGGTQGLFYQCRVWWWVQEFHSSMPPWLMAVRVAVPSLWRFLLPSRDMSSQTLTVPPPTSHAEWYYRTGSKIFSQSSHVLRVTLLSFVKSTEHRVPVVELPILVFYGKNASRAPQCWEWAQGPPLLPSSGLFLILWSERFTPLACWRYFVGIWLWQC